MTDIQAALLEELDSTGLGVAVINSTTLATLVDLAEAVGLFIANKVERTELENTYFRLAAALIENKALK